MVPVPVWAILLVVFVAGMAAAVGIMLVVFGRRVKGG